MGPKKDDKKKGGTSSFEVDPQLYQRPPAAYPVAPEIVPALQPLLKDTLIKISSALPVWNIAGVNWAEAVEADNPDINIKYPGHINVQDKKALRAYLKLEADEPAAVDPKAKGKKPEPKKGAAVDEGLSEPAKDELTGKTLPRMFLENIDIQNNTIEHAGFAPAWPFKSRLDAAQKIRKAEFDRLTAEISAQPDLAGTHAEAIKANDIRDEAPRGGLVDPLMIAAFEVVARIAPGVVADKGESEGMQYLWRSIYPKLPNSNRPCYNPSGKYYVRLFLGDQWRMVLVTDEVPLDGEGEIAIACSSNHLELWPMILAKAVYSAYNKCGYTSSLSNPLDDSQNGSCTKSSAFFIAFAVHVLTGWTPGSPLDLGSCLSKDISRVKSLRDEIVFGGANHIEPSQIPPSSEMLLQSENKHSSQPQGEASTAELSNSLGGLRTKKQFREEYMKKQSEREEVIRVLNERESMITHINNATRKPFAEAFSVCYRDTEGILRVAPVLAVSYVKTESEDDVGQTRLLVKWQVVKKAPYVEPQVDVSTLSAVEQYKAALPKLPIPTEIEMEWVTFNDLQHGQAYVVAHDSLLRTPHATKLAWAWTADEAEEAAGDKGKGKEKGKGKDAAPAAPIGGPTLCVEAGQLEPTLLKVSTSAFFVPAGAGEAKSYDPEAAAALEAQAHELNRLSGIMTPLTPSLSLSIMIQADLPMTSPDAAPKLPSGVILVLQEVRTDDVDPFVMRVELGRDACVPMTRATFHMPADRLSPSEKEPLLFWVRLYTRASVSMTFRSAVPLEVGSAENIWNGCGNGYKALVKTGKAAATPADTEQVLFRLPLQLAPAPESSESLEEKALLFVHVPDMMLAQHLSAGMFSSLSIPPFDSATKPLSRDEVAEEGKALAFNPNFQPSMILPRLGPCIVPLSSVSKNTLVVRCQLNQYFYEMSTGKKGVVDIPGFSWKTVILTKSNSILPPANLQSNNKPARYIGAYYPNRSLLLFRDVITFEKGSFPLALKFGVRPCADKTGGSGSIQAEPSEEEKSSGALTGSTLTAPKTHGRASDDLTSASMRTMPPNHTQEFCEQVRLRLKISRKTDGNLLYESHALSVIQLYNVVIDSFLEKGEAAPVRSAEEAAPADAKAGKKDDKKGKGADTGADLSDCKELVVELFVDENAMQVPSSWRSRLPYAFHAGVDGLDSTDPNAVQAAIDAQLAAARAAVADGSNPGALSLVDIPPVVPQFMWSYDIMCGTVAAVQHDYRDVEAGMKLKAAWAESMPGREEMALNSLRYFTKSKTLSAAKSAESETYFNNDMLEHLQKGIYSKDPSLAKTRLETIFPTGGNTFKENVSGFEEPLAFQTYATTKAVGNERSAEALRLKENADIGLEKFKAFNISVREQTTSRITELITTAFQSESPHASEGRAVESEALAATTIVEWWKMREKYRTDTDKLNESLKFILGRATEAIEKAQIAEGGGDPKKGKKK